MTGRRYIAENGTEITDELVDRWAEEAENGFPGAEVTPFEGRAWGFLLENIDYPVDWQYIREYNRIIGEGLVRDAGRLREYGVRVGGDE